jgi:hypothetical protein
MKTAGKDVLRNKPGPCVRGILQCENGSYLEVPKASNSQERLKVLNTLVQPYEMVKQLCCAVLPLVPLHV